MNSEDKKLALIFGVLIVIITLVFIGSAYSDNKTQTLSVNHQEVLASNEKQAIYLGRPTCGYCNMFEPILDDINERYGFDYYYINTDELSEAQFNEILSTLGVDPSGFGTPYIAFMENGKLVDEHVGYAEGAVFFEKLKENDYVTGEYEPKKTNINYINYDEYNEIVKKDSNQIIVVGVTTCTYCVQLKPILEEIALENKDLVINYVEYNLLSDEGKNVVGTFLSENVDEKWGTPTMIIVKENNVEGFLAGLNTKDRYTDYFKEFGLMR